MKIIEIKNIDDCFDGSGIKEVVFDSNITRSFILSLEKHGTLKYYPEFARPFFKLDIPNKYYIKGVEGNQSLRVFLQKQEYLNDFISLTRFLKEKPGKSLFIN